MGTRRRARVLVPFEIGSFLKAPYGQSWPERVRQAREARSSAPPPTRLDTWLGGFLVLALYASVAGGVWIGIAHWHGWVGAAFGLGIAGAVMLVLGMLVLVVKGIGAVLELRGSGRGTRSRSS